MAPWSFSPDALWLAYFETNPETGTDIWVLPLEGTGTDQPKAGSPQVFLRTSANELHPRFSPDGRWIAYRSDESGANEIWVRPFPPRAGKWPISNGGGLYAIWSSDRQHLYYEFVDRRIMVVEYRVEGDNFVSLKPRVWSERQIFCPGVPNLDLAPDGKAFAVLTMADAATSREDRVDVIMLLNYFDELRRKLP